jgi:hypothetical protein
VRNEGNTGKGLENAYKEGLFKKDGTKKCENKTNKTKTNAFQQRGTIHNHQLTTTKG